MQHVYSSHCTGSGWLLDLHTMSKHVTTSVCVCSSVALNGMVHNSVFLSFWLRLRLDLPSICGNWEYVFLLPHLAHPRPPLCHAGTNLGRRPEKRVTPCPPFTMHRLHRPPAHVSVHDTSDCLNMALGPFWSSGSVVNSLKGGGGAFDCQEWAVGGTLLFSWDGIRNHVQSEK